MAILPGYNQTMIRISARKTIPFLGGLLIAVGALLAYTLTAYRHPETTLDKTRFGALDISKMTTSQIEAATTSYDIFTKDTVLVTLDYYSHPVTPDEVFSDLSATTVSDAALSYSNPTKQAHAFGRWIRSGFKEHNVAHDLVDEEKLDILIADLMDGAGLDEPFFGSIEIVDGDVSIELPKDGLLIDRKNLRHALVEAFSFDEPQSVRADAERVVSKLDHYDFDRAAKRVAEMIDETIIIDIQGSFVELSPADLERIITVTTNHREILVTADESLLADLLPNQEARDAEFDLSDDTNVIVEPDQRGYTVDHHKTAKTLLARISNGATSMHATVDTYTDPEFTSADAHQMNIRHLVSSFTTYHKCCQNRVHNIHLMADAVDETIVMPGDTFDLNKHVGRRTEARGFREAGTIMFGELVDTVGGGVSQFATTFYNAVYWGGYEGNAQKPHSLYFNRYPVGIEATVSWPNPTLRFTNDTDSAILIKTEYGDTYLTVKFYSNNNGRIVTGKQKGGRTHMDVIAEGNNARIVRSEVSDRFNYSDIPTKNIPSLEVPEGKEYITGNGAPGWDVIVKRTVEKPYGEDNQSTWKVRYNPWPKTIAVHPCQLEEYERVNELLEYDYSDVLCDNSLVRDGSNTDGKPFKKR